MLVGLERGGFGGSGWVGDGSRVDGWCGRSGGNSARQRRRRSGSKIASLTDPRDDRADGNGVALLDQCLAENTCDGRGHIDADLIGLKTGDRLVGRNQVTGLLEPSAQRRFGDRFAERRHLHIGWRITE